MRWTHRHASIVAEAMEAALVALVQQLVVNQEAIQQQMRVQGEYLDEFRARNAEETARQREVTNAQVETLRAFRQGRGVIDTKALGRPDGFSGNVLDWQSWAFKFTTWINSQFEGGQALLEWAAGRADEEITQDALDEQAREHPDVNRLSVQLHAVLVSLAKPNTEFMELVRNSVKGNGLDAWRRLSKKFDPASPGANMVLLKRILHPRRANVDNVMAAMEKWEHDLSTYRERTGEVLTNSMMMMCLFQLVPEAMGDHLEIHSARLNTFEACKAEVLRWTEARQSRDHMGAAPMDIGSLNKGKGKWKGGKQGKGPQDRQANESSSSSTQKFEGTCRRCGKQGHKASDCWAPFPWGPNPSSPGAMAHGGKNNKGSKGKGKGTKGKSGKGKGKSKKGKGVHSLDEGWPEEEAAEPAGTAAASLGSLFMLREALRRGPQPGDDDRERRREEKEARLMKVEKDAGVTKEKKKTKEEPRSKGRWLKKSPSPEPEEPDAELARQLQEQEWQEQEGDQEETEPAWEAGEDVSSAPHQTRHGTTEREHGGGDSPTPAPKAEAKALLPWRPKFRQGHQPREPKPPERGTDDWARVKRALMEREQKKVEDLKQQMAEMANPHSGHAEREMWVLSAQLEARQGHVSRLKEELRSRKPLGSPRLEKDLAKGHSYRAAVRKEVSRQRAAQHRMATRKERVMGRLEHEREASPTPEHEALEVSGATYGVEDDEPVESTFVRKPPRATRQYEGDWDANKDWKVGEELKGRSWARPAYDRRHSETSLAAKRARQRETRREQRRASTICSRWLERGSCKMGSACPFCTTRSSPGPQGRFLCLPCTSRASASRRQQGCAPRRPRQRSL